MSSDFDKMVTERPEKSDELKRLQAEYWDEVAKWNKKYPKTSTIERRSTKDEEVEVTTHYRAGKPYGFDVVSLGPKMSNRLKIEYYRDGRFFVRTFGSWDELQNWSKNNSDPLP